MSEEYRSVRLPGPVYRRLQRVRDAIHARGALEVPKELLGAFRATLGGILSAGIEKLEIELGIDPNVPADPPNDDAPEEE